MQEIYTIKEMSLKLELESHVLRYWEKELDLDIDRDNKGHRIYTEKERTTFENIKLLKEQGLQLRAIKMALPNMNDNVDVIDIGNANDDKVKKFRLMMKDVFKEALIEYTDEFKEEIKKELQRDVIVKQEIGEERERLEKERYKKLDQTLREVLKMRKEIACLNSKKNKIRFWE